ncbi:Methylthioribulose-1-phosphate dehydratase [Penicillium canescens]|uniref:Methylthioribulose-1-phosphate dehydratase n=1 Tax=Penicillium canescens TaxID=5083 RepID=UPI0026E0153E|nr:Methylthioribulose-1-phosphate dehydratase [Penicillium canescens]KAJ6062818.1 Methylthioribulose-1-phosphate dehydratase [Penicillium canescens]
MSGSCSYDYSVPGLPSSPDSDITGIGVIINYIATAGLSILIIPIYYVTVYDPSHDPFDKAGEKTILARSNPVDNFILGGLRSGTRYLLKHLRSNQMRPHASVRIANILIKCILVMSDLQTVTGFAILISGYTQLECGLDTSKWRAILGLTWFAYITQLSCLTILQDHLYTHTFERSWRLLATGALATLLAVGLLLTANPMWYDPDDSRPAISIQTSIASAVFVVVAFISRVVRLHKVLSIGILGQAIYWLDSQGRQLLWVLFKWLCAGESIYSLKRSLIYRPLFGAFKTLRLLLVSWASFAVEVGWVCVAFSWGFYRLYLDLGGQSEFFSASREDWTFGQVVSVIMLMAPLISIIGAFNDADTKASENTLLQGPPEEPMSPMVPGSQISQLPVCSTEVTDQEDPENPDIDWALNTTFLGTVTAYCFGVCLAMACFIFTRSQPSYSVSPLEGVSVIGGGVPLVFWEMYFLVLCSIIIELAVPQDMSWLRRSLLSEYRFASGCLGIIHD